MTLETIYFITQIIAVVLIFPNTCVSRRSEPAVAKANAAGE